MEFSEEVYAELLSQIKTNDDDYVKNIHNMTVFVAYLTKHLDTFSKQYPTKFDLLSSHIQSLMKYIVLIKSCDDKVIVAAAETLVQEIEVLLSEIRFIIESKTISDNMKKPNPLCCRKKFTIKIPSSCNLRALTHQLIHEYTK